MNTVSYNDKFLDKYGRTIEYSITEVPFEQKVEGQEDEYIFLGAVLNRILDLRNDLKDLVEVKNTKKNHWVVEISYSTGRIKILQ